MIKKQIKIFFALILLAICICWSGNSFFNQASANVTSLFVENDGDGSDAPVLYSPGEVGMSSTILSRIDSIVNDGINSKAFPGCQVLIMKDGKTVYNKCFGNYTYETAQSVIPNTMYDLASLSKTTGTLMAVMKLYDLGKLKLTDKASSYLSFLKGTDKESITIKDLLFHETGLQGSLSFYRLIVEKKNEINTSTTELSKTVTMGSNGLKYKQEWVSELPSVEFPIQVSDSFYLHRDFHKAAMQMIAGSHLNSKTYLYSCVNFMLLKEIVETISSMPMDVFLNREFFTPLKLNYMAYLPLRNHRKEEIAPTLIKDFLRNGVIQGFVHDPAAAFLGGISGNAGLFANAGDVARIYQMLLEGGKLDGKQYLSAETCQLFSTTTSESGRRGLGFDKPIPSNPKSSPCCTAAPAAVFGHTGYTGTCCWVDPVNHLIYVFLSNRTYPNDGENKLSKMSIRPKIQAVIYQALK